MSYRIAVIGLGYVGLPLAILLSTKFDVVGFDVNTKRIDELKSGFDRTEEINQSVLSTCSVNFTSASDDLSDCNFYIVAVPTPVDDANSPDMSIVLAATKTVGAVLTKGDIVVYESTVYPGATEEECLPVLEEISGLICNEDFVIGYSPERVNPGDKLHTIDKITKVTSGSTPKAAEEIDAVYSAVITAGTFKASSIKVAEAAKVIENTQRDVNIALINELSLIFDRLDIDTISVLEAAGTKWNFLPFRPGLVGGHCIGVDPYYLTYKSVSVGYNPEIILAGRRINDGMGSIVAARLVKELLKRGEMAKKTKVAILGFTFKENCPDTRNTKVIDIVNELQDYGIEVVICDPYADLDEAYEEYGQNILRDCLDESYSAVIITVAHDVFKEMGIEKVREMVTKNGIVYDLKGIFELGAADLRL
ncbi:MAG: nucleotide sugar dehydrogenase [Pseudomonadota bacterium]